MIPFSAIPYRKILSITLEVIEVSSTVLTTIVQALSDKNKKGESRGKDAKGK